MIIKKNTIRLIWQFWKSQVLSKFLLKNNLIVIFKIEKISKLRHVSLALTTSLVSFEHCTRFLGYMYVIYCHWLKTHLQQDKVYNGPWDILSNEN